MDSSLNAHQVPRYSTEILFSDLASPGYDTYSSKGASLRSMKTYKSMSVILYRFINDARQSCRRGFDGLKPRSGTPCYSIEVSKDRDLDSVNRKLL